jgi:EAL domain-containing protein (putative c-di-GMP-specific phosphodiesterase class I)
VEADGRAALLARIPELGLQGDLLVALTRQVLVDVDGLVAEGLDPGRVAMAVPEMALATRSGRRDLDRLLAAHPLGRSRLVLGLPGDVLAARAAEMVREGMAHLRAMGAGLAIHSFGTGQACFRHLRHVPFDELMVDASFVAELGRDAGVQASVEAIGLVARGLGARLVAEGIETEEQRHQLLRIGCGLGGGPLLGGPLDAAGLRRALLHGARPALARVS